MGKDWIWDGAKFFNIKRKILKDEKSFIEAFQIISFGCIIWLTFHAPEKWHNNPVFYVPLSHTYLETNLSVCSCKYNFFPPWKSFWNSSSQLTLFPVSSYLRTQSQVALRKDNFLNSGLFRILCSVLAYEKANNSKTMRRSSYFQS